MRKKKPDIHRRDFIKYGTLAGAGMYFGPSTVFSQTKVGPMGLDDEPLHDWTAWEKFRHTIKHPCLTLKQENFDIARVNIKRYKWAEDYAKGLEQKVKSHLHKITPAFLQMMIEETTPGDPLWTPCPSCRDQGKPVHPHGLWNWEVEKPNQLSCDICQTIFPNPKYPEDILIHTKWGKPQTLTFCGGDPFVIFGYKNGRPSFSANIRSRKVQWMAAYCQTLAEAFFVKKNPHYAQACKMILLRLSACYPHWLVHVGYGEYADMEPRIAALNINQLPYPEVCPPPNIPDYKLWTGYWSAGRASGVGLESDFVRKVVAAYDLTCEAVHQDSTPVYTENERLQIEKDLLLESTVLLVCDKQMNNKSVSNRSATALVGMCIGHPGLVRFGLEGFNKTIDDWYLKDGATSESPFYGLMTLGGIWDMAQASRGYSDPQGYKDSSGSRVEQLDLYQNSNYQKVWHSFFQGLQGDLNYPPYADSFPETKLDVAYVELMVVNYPKQKEYLSLLKAMCGNKLSLHSGASIFRNIDAEQEKAIDPVLILPYDLTKPYGAPSFSFYYRLPGLEKNPSPELALPDWCPPALRIGHLRTGLFGRESLLLLNASHWGIHHEQDSLNLYYWKKGSEVLSDLGYLWDHPLKYKNTRTVAHNTVVIDEKNQESKERGGKILYFKTFENVKVMEMSSEAYPEAKCYKRTSAIIDHGSGQDYVVDFFRVEGGNLQDYVFHGMKPDFSVMDLDLKPMANEGLYDFSRIKASEAAGVWKATWKNKSIQCVAWSLGQEGEMALIAEGWGQRDWKNSDINATIPYIIRRCKGPGIKTFISVFEGYERHRPFVKNVQLIDPVGIVEVETQLGRDYIMSMPESGILKIKSNTESEDIMGHFAVASVQNNALVWKVSLPE